MSNALPNRYPFAEEVPKQGASCATCFFVSKDKEHCRNRFYIAKHGSNELGARADRWCCMAWSAEARS